MARSAEQLQAIERAFADSGIRDTANAHCNDPNAIEDVIQIAIEQCLRYMPEHVPPEKVSGYVNVSVKREAWRAGRTSPESPRDSDVIDVLEESQTPGPHEATVRNEESERVRRAIRQLAPQEALALLLQGAGFTYDEIEQLTGWRFIQINRYLVKARRRLRKRGWTIDPVRK